MYFFTIPNCSKITFMKFIENNFMVGAHHSKRNYIKGSLHQKG